MHYLPTGDLVLVELVETTSSTESGIIIADTSIDDFTRGVVIAKGPGKYQGNQLVQVAVNEGDRVLMFKKNRTALKSNGKSVVLVAENEILAVIVD